MDNLNANRQAHLQESAYLAGILDDLGSDTESLRQRETTAIRGLEVADRLLALREAPTLSAPADSLATWFFRAAFPRFLPTPSARPSIVELLSDGQFVGQMIHMGTLKEIKAERSFDYLGEARGLINAMHETAAR